MASAAASASPAAATSAKIATATPFQTFTSLFREAHPIGRAPAYLKPHDAPDMSHYLRRMGRTGKMFVPFMVAFFGWPFLMKGLINASNGVRAPAKEKVKARNWSKISRKNAIDSEAWAQRVPA